MKTIIYFITTLFSLTGFAHNPDFSTTMLVEQEHNVWVLQISASLTAFQQEIRGNFAETPYKTPEEFQKMVLEHIKNNFQVSFNGGEFVSFGKGLVKLGHETKVVFEVLGIPKDITSVRVRNTTFDDMSRSQSALLLYKNGFSKEKFILNRENEYTLALETKGNNFVEVTQAEAGFFSKYFGFMLLGFLSIGSLVFFIIGKKKSNIQNLS